MTQYPRRVLAQEWGIGVSNTILAPALPDLNRRSRRWRCPQHAAACRSSAPQGVARLSAAWICRSGGGTGARQGIGVSNIRRLPDSTAARGDGGVPSTRPHAAAAHRKAWHGLAQPGYAVQEGIGVSNTILAPALPDLNRRSRRWRCPQHAAACRSSAPQGVARLSAAWICRSGWVTGARQGITGSEGIGTAHREKLGGTISNGISQQQGGELRRGGAHFAYGTTPQVVSLGASKECLAKAGRGNGRWDGRQLEMAQNTGNHRFMRDGSNDPQ